MQSNFLRTLRRFAGPIAALAIGGSALVVSPSEAHAQSKIAVVDVRRAVLETEEGLRVQATLRKLFDSRNVELDAKQRELQQVKDALDKERIAGKSPKEALEKKYEKLQKDAAELQGTMVEYQREMQRKEGDLTNPILQKILDIVRRIAATEGYEMILDKSVVPYYRSDLEITDRAIQMFNSGQGASPQTPPGPGGKPPALPPKDGANKPPAPPPAAPPPAPAPAKKK
jgi:outer membrane protein